MLKPRQKALAQLMVAEPQLTKAEYAERIGCAESSIYNWQQLAEFRESIGDNYGAMEYMDKLKELDPRNQFVADNYEKYKNGSENSGFGAFFKKIFGKRMG